MVVMINAAEAASYTYKTDEVTISKKQKLQEKKIEKVKAGFLLKNDKEKKVNVLASIGLGLSIASLLILGFSFMITNFLTIIFGLPLAISGLVMSLIARNKLSKSKLGSKGMGNAVAGALIGFISTIVLFVVYAILGIGIF